MDRRDKQSVRCAAGACPPDQVSRVLVLDDVQQLLSASDSPLPALLAMREQVKGCRLPVSSITLTKAAACSLQLQPKLHRQLEPAKPAHHVSQHMSCKQPAHPTLQSTYAC
jgi:hypothetical protein